MWIKLKQNKKYILTLLEIYDISIKLNLIFILIHTWYSFEFYFLFVLKETFRTIVKEFGKDAKLPYFIIDLKNMKIIVFQNSILKISLILYKISHLSLYVLYKPKTINIQFWNKISEHIRNRYYNEFLFYICKFSPTFSVTIILVYLFYLLFISRMLHSHNLCFILHLILIYKFYITFVRFCFVYQ